MKIDRQKQVQFLKDELRAESESFKRTFLTKANSLLIDNEVMYLGQYQSFKNGDMIVKMPNTRNLPRKGEHVLVMLLPKELQSYRNWGNRTYKDLFDERYKSSEAVCIWHARTDDKLFSKVGFRKVDIDFAVTMETQAKGNILVFAPLMPPLNYIANLQNIAEDMASSSVAKILDADYRAHDWEPILIRQHDVTSFIETQLFLADTMLLQGPPGTGKTYMIAELCARLCKEGKSVLVTALTNRALMEIAGKSFLADLLRLKKVFKTNMTIDEQQEQKDLMPLTGIAPMPSCLVLSTYYISSSYAAEQTENCPFDVVIMDEASQALLAMFAAAKKLGRTNLWVGDVRQLAPVVLLNEDHVKASGYYPMIDGLKTIVEGSTYPVYQLTNTYRLTARGARYTGLFYGDTLVSKSECNHLDVPHNLRAVLNPQGGPALVLTDMPTSDKAPQFALHLASALVASIIAELTVGRIALLTCFIRTARAIQRSIAQTIDKREHLIIDTIARVQGLTAEVTILLVPNGSYVYSLDPRVFNVATSRAREHTIIIADKNVLSYAGMDANVRLFLERVYEDQSVYIPATNVGEKRLGKPFTGELEMR